MRLVGTRGNVLIVEQRKFIYFYYLIYINNATIRFLFALGPRKMGNLEAIRNHKLIFGNFYRYKLYDIRH